MVRPSLADYSFFMHQPTLTAIKILSRDAIAGLMVLALVFLSFGHQPLPGRTNSVVVQVAQISALSFCGGDVDPQNHDNHDPCHACRVSIADLPPAPCGAEPAYAGFVTLAYAAVEQAAPFDVLARAHNPRAPPASI